MWTKRVDTLARPVKTRALRLTFSNAAQELIRNGVRTPRLQRGAHGNPDVVLDLEADDLIATISICTALQADRSFLERVDFQGGEFDALFAPTTRLFPPSRPGR